ncbi:AIR synthase-related protein [Butyrivibrio sp. AE2032]|uniref:AIR synthase-related protein n=1 Tax=Butyrivibrio sp. AE2032 TaxID=1458463 RepID=UPI000555F277|nr:AIR synthase-related protein [Butyrivibrio sp. AE2032]
MRIGKITENALKRSVLKQIRTEYKGIESAAVGSDCAFSNDKRAFSAICPVTADISNPGFYAVIKAANSLIAQGIQPDHVTLSILLPADAEEKTLKTIVSDAIEAARICETTYAGGHTEVTEAVNRAIVTATAVGYERTVASKEEGSEAVVGKAGKKADLEHGVSPKPRAGQDLVITKWIALEGTAMLAKEKQSELVTRYPAPFIDGAADFRDFLDIRKEAQVIAQLTSKATSGQNLDADTATGTGGISVHDLSSGGVYAALWEMAERAGCGLRVDLKSIPVKQETIEICEFFEVNPYQLISGGSLLIACDDGEKLVESLEEAGIHAAVIGSLKEGNDRIIVNDDEERFLELPQADEIHKVL